MFYGRWRTNRNLFWLHSDQFSSSCGRLKCHESSTWSRRFWCQLSSCIIRAWSIDIMCASSLSCLTKTLLVFVWDALWPLTTSLDCIWFCKHVFPNMLSCHQLISHAFIMWLITKEILLNNQTRTWTKRCVMLTNKPWAQRLVVRSTCVPKNKELIVKRYLPLIKTYTPEIIETTFVLWRYPQLLPILYHCNCDHQSS